jgi:predicted helicase
VPDLNCFRGSCGGKDVLPLYRAADASEANIAPALLKMLNETYKLQVTPEDFLAYVYGVLAHPGFTSRFMGELETRELRVPITRNAKLFLKCRDAGARLIWLHTYGERFVPEGKHRGQVPRGMARCVKAIPGDHESYPESFVFDATMQTLHVGQGEFAPVAREVFEFEVSGLKVLQSWLKYRMRKGAGKKSSPLDDIRPERWTGDFTSELLELVWVLEATIAEYREQEELLGAVLADSCVGVEALPAVPPGMRKPPAGNSLAGDLFEEV